MTQFVQAIYEHGVFRPLQPVILPEHEQVSLEIRAADRPATETEVLGRQREALAKLRTEMDALPEQAPQDGLGGVDHDLILYGWRK